MGWFEERFQEKQGRLRRDCEVCSRPMWFPACKHGKYLTCGADCAEKRLERIRDERKMHCATCGDVFFPRLSQLRAGCGKYCSHKCSTPSHVAMNSEEAQIKSRKSFREAIQSGRYRPLRGKENPRWMGGPAACRMRRQADGRSAMCLRRYRAKNKHKVREFAKRRSGRKCGRLPRGTVAKIGLLQRWRCAICRKGVRDNYHVDHIVALANGGAHAADNIQILCPTCNVRKSAKDPIRFMQEMGFLL